MRLRVAGDERLVELVRRGDRSAFEVIYDRHATALLSFCVYMLGSQQDAEDAIQATFSSAYRSLLADDRAINLKPWLFAIARNACLTILRQRRPWVELNGEPALGADPLHKLEVRDEVRHVVDGLLALPEPQRAALVLAEMHGLSQSEIATMLGVQPKQVKAYAYQARANLISERAARETDCREIREELATARGADRLRSRLRRHLRACDGCRDYERGLARHQRQFSALIPVIPSLALKARTLELTLGSSGAGGSFPGAKAVGGGAAGTAALAGGVKSLATTLVAGVACVGACGVGATVLGIAVSPSAPATSASTAHGPLSLTASTGGVNSAGGVDGATAAGAAPGNGPNQSNESGAQPSAGPTWQISTRTGRGSGSSTIQTGEVGGQQGGVPVAGASPAPDQSGRLPEPAISAAPVAARSEPTHSHTGGQGKQKTAGEEHKLAREERKQAHEDERKQAREQKLQEEEARSQAHEQEERERLEAKRSKHEAGLLEREEHKAEHRRRKIEREERKKRLEEVKIRREEAKAAE